MDELSQFSVSIFHCRGEKREQSGRGGGIQGLTNNILILSASFCFSSRSSSVALLISPSPSICVLFPFSSRFAFYLFFAVCGGWGCVTSPPYIPHRPLLVFSIQSQYSTGSAPILWPSNPLYNHVTINVIAWCHTGGIKHACFIIACLSNTSPQSPPPPPPTSCFPFRHHLGFALYSSCHFSSTL